MKNTELKNLSGNELCELIDLTSHLCNEIENYCHVSDYLPKIIDKNIREFNSKLINELNRRETESI